MNTFLGVTNFEPAVQVLCDMGWKIFYPRHARDIIPRVNRYPRPYYTQLRRIRKHSTSYSVPAVAIASASQNIRPEGARRLVRDMGALEIASISSTVGVNVLLSLMVCTRVLFARRRLANYGDAVPLQLARYYLGLVPMIVESALPSVILGLVFLALYTRKSSSQVALGIVYEAAYVRAFIALTLCLDKFL